MDPADLEFLLTDGGRRLLSAAMASYDDIPAVTLNARLRTLVEGASPGQVAAAMSQTALRRKAIAKFGPDAPRLFFTPDGLEQATSSVLAAWRAAQARAITLGTLADLGCGIGADLVAFARVGFQVTGYDTDLLTARIAAANLEALGQLGTARLGAAEEVTPEEYDVLFADPARRTVSGRVFDPRAASPGWDVVAGLLTAAAAAGARPRLAAVKLAPGLDHGLIPANAEAEWVSLDGDLKEAVLWSHPDTEPSRRRATVLRSDGRQHTLAHQPDTEPPSVGGVGAFVYEPDPAVVRAHLVSRVTALVGGWLLDPHVAYVSADRRVATPFARTFRVLDVLPYQEKALRAALRARDIGPLTIKKRGVAVRPEDLRRRLALRGSRSATIILTRTPGSAAALLVEPVE